MRTEEFNGQFHFTGDSESTGTNKAVAPCCRGCAYEDRCERDTSWRGRCPDYAEYETDG